MKKHKWISYFLSLLAIFTVFGATNVHKIFAGEVKPDVKITNFTLSLVFGIWYYPFAFI